MPACPPTNIPEAPIPTLALPKPFLKVASVFSPVDVRVNEPVIIALPLTSNLALIGVVFPIATFVASSYITPVDSVDAPVNLAT